MAEKLTRTIPVLASNGTGAALDVDGLDGKYVELSGTFVATVTFELCFDNVPTVWRAFTAETAPTGFFVDEPATHIRAVTSGYASGTPAAIIRGSV